MDRQPTKPVEKDYPVPFITDIPFFNLSLGTYNYQKPTTEPSQEPSSRPVRAKDMTPFHKGFDDFVRARKDEKRAAERMKREASKRQRRGVQAHRKASRGALKNKAKPDNGKPISAKPTEPKPTVPKAAPTVRRVRVKHQPVDLAGWCSHARNGPSGPGAKMSGVVSGRIEKRRDNGRQ